MLRLSWSSMSSTPSPGVAPAGRTAAAGRATRSSRSCSPRWTDSGPKSLSSSSVPPTGSNIVDDALLRPSRFRAIRIDLPNEEAREDIARVHAGAFLREQPSDELFQAIAKATEGMNGDEIRSVFRDARADELLDGPNASPDAYRFGELIGALRRAQQQRENAQSRALGRPSPGTSYIPLTPAAAQPPSTPLRPIPAEFTIPHSTQEDS